jgi:hypothetical protein
MKNSEKTMKTTVKIVTINNLSSSNNKFNKKSEIFNDNIQKNRLKERK